VTRTEAMDPDTGTLLCKEGSVPRHVHFLVTEVVSVVSPVLDFK